jgi:hypothetical protein
MESRILISIAECWENTINKQKGIFSRSLKFVHPLFLLLTMLICFRHPDPFYGKQEFAPTDKPYLAKRQQHIYNVIAPHYRLLQFLSSHFNATRLGNPDIELVYSAQLRMCPTACERSILSCSPPRSTHCTPLHNTLLCCQMAFERPRFERRVSMVYKGTRVRLRNTS